MLEKPAFEQAHEELEPALAMVLVSVLHVVLVLVLATQRESSVALESSQAAWAGNVLEYVLHHGAAGSLWARREAAYTAQIPAKRSLSAASVAAEDPAGFRARCAAVIVVDLAAADSGALAVAWAERCVCGAMGGELDPENV